MGNSFTNSGNIKDSAIAVGNNASANLTQANTTQQELPDGFDPSQTITELIALLRDVQTSDQRRFAGEVQILEEDGAQAEPNQEEIGTALTNIAGHLESANELGEQAGAIWDKMSKLASWVGGPRGQALLGMLPL